jgi:Tfp pilus assembly protein PilN
MTLIRVNLIPQPRMLRKRLARRARNWGLALAVYVVLLGAVVAVALSSREPLVIPDDSGVRTRITHLTADFAQVDQELADARFKHAAALELTGHPDWSALLAVLGDTLGDDVVARDVKLTQQPTTSTSPRQYTLDLRGLAKSQAAVTGFVTRLEETHLFDQVRLLRTGREPFLTGSAVTFDLQCPLTDAPRGPAAPAVQSPAAPGATAVAPTSPAGGDR